MILGKKKYRDEAEKVEAQRQKLIAYKKFFHSDEGREVLTDLMNRFSLVFDYTVKEVGAERTLGRNDVIGYILSQTEYPMEQFDKIVRGEK
jgi:hypothetical protein